MASMDERLTAVEKALEKIGEALVHISERLAYLDRKADQTALQHWDLADELSAPSGDAPPELEPDDGDEPQIEWGPAERATGLPSVLRSQVA